MIRERLTLLNEAAAAATSALRSVDDWGLSGRRLGQYTADLVVDDAVLQVLRRAGVGVLSEESGYEPATGDEVIIVDPLDGSTNASRGVPWYATALLLLDGEGPAAALVVNQASGVRYWAERGGGAWCDERRLTPSSCAVIGEAVVGLNGIPPGPIGAAQVRMFGAAALDLCLVADGVLDGYIDFDREAHGVWDFAASSLICREAGVTVVDAQGRPLVVLDHAARRTPIAAATPTLLADLLTARQG